MLFTDVNEQYKIRAHAYVIGWCPNTMLLLMVIAETTNNEESTLRVKLILNTFIYIQHVFVWTHIAHASSCSSSKIVSVSVFVISSIKCVTKMLNLQIDKTTTMTTHDHSIWAYSLIQQYFHFICKTDWIEYEQQCSSVHTILAIR